MSDLDNLHEQPQGVLAYLQNTPQKSIKQKAKKAFNRYFIDAFTGMAQGLFCTLIAGTILAQIASWCGDNAFAHVLNVIASVAKLLMGAGIGIGIVHKLGAKPLVIFTAAVVGLIGAYSGNLVSMLVNGAAPVTNFGDSIQKAGTFIVIDTQGVGGKFEFLFGAPGNPIGSYVLSVLAIEIAGLYAGKTKLDIVLIPLGMMLICFVGIFIAWPFIKLIDAIALVLVLAIKAGEAVKIIVGIFVAVVMGILLTMPTSSAAIWVAIATSETALANPDVFAIAGGAAVAGCAAHMVGFAVASFRENGVSGLISQGIGTSMLQIPNIMKKPAVLLPQIVSSVFSGLTAVLMGLRCNASGGGMGTSGLVGIFGTIDASVGAVDAWKIAVGIILSMFVLPAIISFATSELMRKKGWISFGDQKL